MQTVSLKMKAGDLKKVIDLPNFNDDQRVKVVISDDTTSKKIDERAFNDLLKEIKTFWANHEKLAEKSIAEYRIDRLAKKINSLIVAEKNLAIMEDIEKIIGDDKGWENEEAMIKDLAEMRRRRKNLENYA